MNKVAVIKGALLAITGGIGFGTMISLTNEMLMEKYQNDKSMKVFVNVGTIGSIAFAALLGGMVSETYYNQQEIVKYLLTK